jgi:glutamate transport system permease protein
MSTSVLYDAPGPRARTLYRIAAALTLAALAGVAWFVYKKFNDTGQWDGDRWNWITNSLIWKNIVWVGIQGTLKAFAVGAVLAVVFGLVFGVGRMSHSVWVQWASGAVVEFFRSIPLLLLMFFLYYLNLFQGSTNAFFGVVVGLMLYNGSVLAEVVRAGVNSLPKGQREAGLAIGLTQGQVMRSILLPQGLRAMLPAVIAQLVVLLMDTALGFIVGYVELLRQMSLVGPPQTLIPAAIVFASMFIAMNMSLGALANWVEKRLRRQGKTAAPVGHGEDVAMTSATAGGPGAGQEW